MKIQHSSVVAIVAMGTLVMLTLPPPLVGLAQEEETADGVYIVFDASGSMWGQLPDKSPKIQVAKQVLQDFVAGDFSGRELALRVYGHRREGDCTDSQLVIPFGPSGEVVSRLRDFMGGINPKGKTPISYSLTQARKDFGDRRGELILITDGLETCDQDPCELVREWAKSQVQIRVHVVGLGLDEESSQTLQCISQAAGTEYHDAQSAASLADSLSQIQQRTVTASLLLRGVDAAGNTMRVEGTVTGKDGQITQVTSGRRNRVDAGEYVLRAGVRTRNGNLYQPVTRNVRVLDGETRVEVEVAVPPSVKAKYMDGDKEARGAQVKAFQDGKEVFAFRWIDRVYLDPGSYEFRSQPNPENDLSVSESFAAGDHKEIVFELRHTVKVRIKMVAQGSGIRFRQNLELWQEGEQKYRVHTTNGALVLPGTYELRLPDRLTPYVKPQFVVTDEDEQDMVVTVPVGHVTVVYQRPDGSRDEDKRCFMGQGPNGKGIHRNAGQKYPLVPGTYNVIGWRGEYERVVFEVKEGEDQVVVLQAKP